MVIKEIKYSKKELIFRTPFQTSQATYKKKNFLIVELIDELNNSAYGECSPLPEFETETFEQAETKLINLQTDVGRLGCHSLSRYFIGRSFSDINVLENTFSEFLKFPALRFAFEQAFFTLISKREKDLFKHLYGMEPLNSINVNAVIGFEEPGNIIKKVDEFLNKGFKTIKLKCGRDNFNDDYKIIELIKNEFGNNLNLRIDVNGKWSFDKAINNLKALQQFNFEYIEQPVFNNEELTELEIITEVNIAADESVKSFTDAKYLLKNGIKFLVVKPTVAGGILNTIKIMREAKKHNAKIVISSAFERAVGKSVLVYFASLTNHNLAHGLGVDNLFEQNICEDFYPVQNGQINFDINNFPPEFKFL